MSRSAHIDHIEDCVWLGSEQTEIAIRLLAGLLSPSPDTVVTIKYDGLDIHWGMIDGSFGMATKSWHNQTPKIYRSADQLFSGNPSLYRIFFPVYRTLASRAWSGFHHGNLLFWTKPKPRSTIGGEFLTFRANTLTYGLPVDCDASGGLSEASVGISVDDPALTSDSNIWFCQTRIPVSDIQIPLKDQITDNLSELAAEVGRFQKLLYETLPPSSIDRKMLSMVHQFHRMGIPLSALRLINALSEKLSMKEAEFLTAYSTELDRLILLSQRIEFLKVEIMARLKTDNPCDMRCWLDTPHGLKPTDHEGFVISRSDLGRFKMVDRKTFTRINHARWQALKT